MMPAWKETHPNKQASTLYCLTKASLAINPTTSESASLIGSLEAAFHSCLNFYGHFGRSAFTEGFIGFYQFISLFQNKTN